MIDIYDLEKESFQKLEQLLSLSLQAAWVVSVCLPSYLAPAKHPTFLTVVPLLPVVLLHHPLNNTLSPFQISPASSSLDSWKAFGSHHTSGRILLTSAPTAHCPPTFQCQVKNPIDLAWLSEPESR